MPRRSAEKLTKRFVETLAPVAGKDFSIWDRDIPGFSVRVKPTGAKTYEIKYYAPDGRQRKKSLGKVSHLTLDEARKLARIELGKVAGGGDPVADAKREKGRMTIAELCDRYYRDAEAGRVLYRNRPKKPSTLAVDKGRIERHIKPLLGSIMLGDLTRANVERFMFDVRDGKTCRDVRTKPRGRSIVRGGIHVGAKSVMLLSAMHRYAIRKGWVDANPCHDIDKPADCKRTRYLNAKEYAALGRALKLAERQGFSSTTRDATIALLLTGCRRSEILKATWGEIDAAGRCFRFLDTKTGPQMRPCGQAAMDRILSRGIGKDDEWVFPSPVNEGPLTEVRKFVYWLNKEAGLEGVSPHVYRHSYATVAFELGYSELIIAGLLGHRVSSVTGRYAHQVDHVLADAADHVSDTFLRRMGIHTKTRHADEMKHVGEFNAVHADVVT